MKKKKDVYEIITDKIIEGLENECIPWRKPWIGRDLNPKNFISKKEYSGINFFLLQLLPYESQYFLTYNQIKLKGGSVKKGSKSAPIVFYKQIEKKSSDSSNEKKSFSMLRYYKVFNLDQVDNISAPDDSGKLYSENCFNSISEAENLLEIIKTKLPTIVFKYQNRAYYNYGSDLISLPEKGQFKTNEEYYSTLFHEAIHSTGHSVRLNRSSLYKSNSFGDHLYSYEELVAEMGNAYLCSMCGISNATIDNSQNYIKNWLKVLKNDKKMVVKAAADAQKAVKFLLS